MSGVWHATVTSGSFATILKRGKEHPIKRKKVFKLCRPKIWAIQIYPWEHPYSFHVLCFWNRDGLQWSGRTDPTGLGTPVWNGCLILFFLSVCASLGILHQLGVISGLPAGDISGLYTVCQALCHWKGDLNQITAEKKKNFFYESCHLAFKDGWHLKWGKKSIQKECISIILQTFSSLKYFIVARGVFFCLFSLCDLVCEFAPRDARNLHPFHSWETVTLAAITPMNNFCN